MLYLVALLLSSLKLREKSLRSNACEASRFFRACKSIRCIGAVTFHYIYGNSNRHLSSRREGICSSHLDYPVKSGGGFFIYFRGFHSCYSLHASSHEEGVTNEALKHVLSPVEEDQISNKGTCDIYVKKIIKIGNFSDAAHMFRSFRTKQIFLSPDAYKTLLTSAAEAKNLELFSLVFKDLLVITKSPDSSSYMNLAKAFEDSDDDTLHKFIREVSELTFSRSATVLNRIIFVFAQSGQIEKALGIFENMKTLKCKPDVVTYNTVLAILGNAGRIDQMLQEFSSMKETGHVPDIITYNTLINCLRKMGRLDLCLVLLKEMVERQIHPDLRTYTALVDGFGRLGKIEEALKIFNEMKRGHIQPSISVYRGLISNLKKAGKMELARSLLEEMNSQRSELVHPKDFKWKNRIYDIPSAFPADPINNPEATLFPPFQRSSMVRFSGHLLAQSPALLLSDYRGRVAVLFQPHLLSRLQASIRSLIRPIRRPISSLFDASLLSYFGTDSGDIWRRLHADLGMFAALIS